MEALGLGHEHEDKQEEHKCATVMDDKRKAAFDKMNQKQEVANLRRQLHKISRFHNASIQKKEKAKMKLIKQKREERKLSTRQRKAS